MIIKSATLQYTHPENREKPFVDWRNPDSRMEGFLRWLKWRMDWCDLDHYMCNNTYRDTPLSSTGEPMTEEQTYWFCMIFGMTYQSEMAWVIYNEFPDFWGIDLEGLQKWNVKNMSRQKYSRDCKYNKGRITDQVASMREVIGPSKSIKKFFEDLVQSDEDQTFEKAYSVIKDKFFKFGRMTSWLACQTLAETARYPARPKTMLASDPSSWSVRSGLMYVYGRDEMIEAKDKSIKITHKDIEWVNYKEQELFSSSKLFLGKKHESTFTHYLLESHLCQYKKLMLGGDYAGHSSGDHVSRACWLAERWPEVNFDPFFKEAVENHHVLVRGKRESKGLRDLCLHTGQMVNMHLDYGDMPDVCKEIGIDLQWLDEGDKGDKKIRKQTLSYAEGRSLLY